MSPGKKSAPIAVETPSQDPLPTPHVSVGPAHRVGAHDTGVNVLLSSIELDATIQCRADIEMATVNEYAEAMHDGAAFPPVVLFGTPDKSWIGDGWHRIMAARSTGADEIAADLRPGGKSDALRFALSANAAHGRRRTNADKRSAVAIALREFGKLSDRAIAEMCAVSHPFVEGMRRALNPGGNDYHLPVRTGRDGKQYPARPAPKDDYEDRAPAPVAEPQPQPTLGPPRVGLQFARIAIMKLEEIRPDDAEREQAFDRVEEWLREHRTNPKGATPCPGSR